MPGMEGASVSIGRSWRSMIPTGRRYGLVISSLIQTNEVSCMLLSFAPGYSSGGFLLAESTRVIPCWAY